MGGAGTGAVGSAGAGVGGAAGTGAIGGAGASAPTGGGVFSSNVSTGSATSSAEVNVDASAAGVSRGAETSGVESKLRTPEAPMMSAEGQVGGAVGSEGNQVLRGGGTGLVERDLGGSDVTLAEQDLVAQRREAERGTSDARYAAGEAQFAATATPSSAAGRFESAEFHQRDGIAADAQAADDARAQVRRTVDDPTSVASERAGAEASSRAQSAMPADVRSAQSQATSAANVVEDPAAAARERAESAAAEQEQRAEVNVGIRGPDGETREGSVSTSTTGGEKK